MVDTWKSDDELLESEEIFLFQKFNVSYDDKFNIKTISKLD